MAKRDLKKLFRGKDTVGEELKEAKAIKSGKITPMQYAKGEKMEKPEKSEMRKFAKAGSTLSDSDRFKRQVEGAKADMDSFKTSPYAKSTKSDPVVDKIMSARPEKSDVFSADEIATGKARRERNAALVAANPKAYAPKATPKKAPTETTASRASRQSAYEDWKKSQADIRGTTLKKGGKVKTKCYATGGSVGKGDGCATKGRTKGRIV